MSKKIYFLLVGVVFGAAMLSALPTKKKVSFMVVGDMPYLANTAADETSMLQCPDGEICQAIRDIDPPVLLHLGDLKDGDTSCTDDFLRGQRDQLGALLPGRVVYTPGDNDWTDCDRSGLEERFDELERKDFLLSIFFEEKQGRQIDRAVEGIVRQKEMSENAFWQTGALAFVTIHVVGTNNGRSEVELTTPVERAWDYADFREKYNARWLNRALKKSDRASGVVIALQEDIYRTNADFPDVDCTSQNRQNCDGLKNTRELIKSFAREINKPVLVIHGSTGAFCFHQLYPELPNLWRFNAFGDFKVSDVAEVIFDPDKSVPFSVRSVLVEREIPKSCL